MQLLQRNEKIAVREIGGETLLIPIHQTGVDLQKVYLLNDTAAATWGLLEQPRTMDDLVDALQQEFDADFEQIREGVTMLLDELIANDFVSRFEGR